MSTYPHFGTNRGTNAIHVGQDPEQWNCKALVPPIFTTTTYKQDEPGKPVRIIVTYCSLHSLCFSFCLFPSSVSFLLSFSPSLPFALLLPPFVTSLLSPLPSPQPMHDYIREGNPTRTALEKSVAACEGAQYGKYMNGFVNIIITVHQ